MFREIIKILQGRKNKQQNKNATLKNALHELWPSHCTQVLNGRWIYLRAMWIHESKGGKAAVTLVSFGGFESLKLKTKRLFYKLLPTEAQHHKPLTFSRLQPVTGLQHSCAEHFKHFFSIMLNSRNLSQLTSLRPQPRRITLGQSTLLLDRHTEAGTQMQSWIKTWCPERSRF